MLSRLAAVAVVVAFAAVACGSPAVSPSPSPSATGHHASKQLAKGTVVSVTATSITLDTKKAGQQTFPLAPDVIIKQGGSKVALTAVTPGETVVLFPAASNGASPSGGQPEVGRITVKLPPASPSPSATPSPSGTP